MEDTEEFKWAAKVIIRRQLRDLMRQLQEYGDEVAVMLVNASDDMYTHFGSSAGEWFISEQRNLMTNFLSFCKNREPKKTNSIFDSEPMTTSPSKKRSVISLPLETEAITEVLEINMSNATRDKVTDVALESLVGRLVALVLSGSLQKARDVLVDQDEGSDLALPTISRSGRKIRPKVQENFISVKKTAQPSSILQDGKKILESLGDLDTTVLQRVQVKIGSGKFTDVASTPIPTSVELRGLAVSILNDLDYLDRVHKLSNKKHIKVEVTCGDDLKDGNVKVQLKKSQKDMNNEILETETYLVGTGPTQNDHEDASVLVKDEDEAENSAMEQHAIQNDFACNPELPLSENTILSKKTKDKPYEARCKLVPTLKQRVEARKSMKPKRKIPKKIPKVPCDYCGQMLTGLGSLKDHIKCVHLNIRDSVCKVCGKAFFKWSKLNIHMVDVHTRQCSSCLEYVEESEPWKEGTHNYMIRTVLCKCGEEVPIVSTRGRTSSKPRDKPGTKYPCGVCGKIFSHKRMCVNHAKSHRDMKDFLCGICGKFFTYDNSLKRHLQSEHGLLQNICEVCGGVYTSETSLKIHMTKVHGFVDLGENYNLDREMAKKRDSVQKEGT